MPVSTTMKDTFYPILLEVLRSQHCFVIIFSRIVGATIHSMNFQIDRLFTFNLYSIKIYALNQTKMETTGHRVLSMGQSEIN